MDKESKILMLMHVLGLEKQTNGFNTYCVIEEFYDDAFSAGIEEGIDLMNQQSI